MSLSYYFNILEVGFVVLGGLMLLGMILKQQYILFRYFGLSILIQLNYNDNRVNMGGNQY
ncbi:hypothetical protein EXW58_01940 [Bacillus mycoides]|nr:hypothetical protein EXW58_01940 [Bacillus mycoides]